MTSLTLVRQIRARPSIVFEFLSTAEGMAAWWGPDDLPVLSAEADVRVGGQFRIAFRTIDGAQHTCAGEYLEIDPPSRVVMTWRWASGGEPQEADNVSRLEMHVRPTDIGSELTLTHAQLRNAASEASHRGGWGGALDKLQALLDRAPASSDGD
jgi:uncharacterized protein YndB with AHSA1/START domain